MSEDSVAESESGGLLEDMAAVSVGPWEVSESLRPRIEELGLERNVKEMREQGATVVTDAVPHDLLDEMREVIHQMAKEETVVGEGAGHAKGVTEIAMMLGKSSVVDRIMVHPKLLAMWEFSTGQGFRAGTVAGTILPQSEANGEFLGVPLHADQAWLPQPWPEQK